METNNDSPNPIREDDWNEAAEENYPQELTEVLQAADVAEQLEQAQEEGALIDVSDELPKAFVLTEEYGMRRVYLTQLGAATLQRRLEAARDGNL